MVFDLDLIKKLYGGMPGKVDAARKLVGTPLTLAEKILYSHLFETPARAYERGKDYVDFAPDRVAMQDATAQMALLQFMTCGRDRVAVPSTVHCDHLIQAKTGAAADLATAKDVNKEVYDFLASIISPCMKWALPSISRICSRNSLRGCEPRMVPKNVAALFGSPACKAEAPFR